MFIFLWHNNVYFIYFPLKMCSRSQEISVEIVPNRYKPLSSCLHRAGASSRNTESPVWRHMGFPICNAINRSDHSTLHWIRADGSKRLRSIWLIYPFIWYFSPRYIYISMWLTRPYFISIHAKINWSLLESDRLKNKISFLAARFSKKVNMLYRCLWNSTAGTCC